MEKTVYQWLDTLPETLKVEALNNVNKQRGDEAKTILNRNAKSLAAAIVYAFDWSKTPQGFIYWNNVRKTNLPTSSDIGNVFTQNLDELAAKLEPSYFAEAVDMPESAFEPLNPPHGISARRLEMMKEEHAKPKDNVNHPKHYTQGDIECIDAIAAAVTGLSGMESVCTANAIKYLWRWKQKNGLEDLKKAQWYISKLVTELEKCKNN